MSRILTSVVVVLALAACGGSDGPRSAVRLDAAGDGSLRFESRTLDARAGRTSIAMGNPSDVPHAIGVRGKGIEEVGETAGRVETHRAARSFVASAPGDANDDNQAC